MLSDGPIISLKSVMLRYENGEKAIKNIDLSLYAPSFQYITGLSGSGKTSLLKLIGLIQIPTAGNYILFGKNVNDLTDNEICEFKRNIGYVHQNIRFIDSMNIVDNVALPLKIAGFAEAKREQMALELLDWFKFKRSKTTYPYELSAGQRQCLAIARAVIIKPKILLADDPISYMDSRMANKVVSLFFEMSKNNTCVIITNNNEQKIPPLLKQSKEIKMAGGMIVDNFAAFSKKSDLPIAI